MKLITIDCGNTSRRSPVPHLARNKILPSLIPVNSQVKPTTNDDPVLKYLPRHLEIQAMNDDVLEIAVLSPAWFNLTLTPTISSSILAIDIDSCNRHK